MSHTVSTQDLTVRLVPVRLPRAKDDHSLTRPVKRTVPVES